MGKKRECGSAGCGSDDDDDNGLTWHGSPRTARTHNSNVGSHSSQYSETLMRQNSCKTGQKVQSSVFCGKLVVMAMHVLSPANCSKQMQQPPEGSVADGSMHGAWCEGRWRRRRAQPPTCADACDALKI